ncbi:MAG: hypothetical protein ACLGIV_10460 [Actinomycetes bacterium]
MTVEALPYSMARRTVPGHVATLDAQYSCEVLWRTDGTPLAVFSDTWRLGAVHRDHPDLVLEPLAAGRV